MFSFSHPERQTYSIRNLSFLNGIIWRQRCIVQAHAQVWTTTTEENPPTCRYISFQKDVPTPFPTCFLHPPQASTFQVRRTFFFDFQMRCLNFLQRGPYPLALFFLPSPTSFLSHSKTKKTTFFLNITNQTKLLIIDPIKRKNFAKCYDHLWLRRGFSSKIILFFEFFPGNFKTSCLTTRRKNDDKNRWTFVNALLF